MPARATAILIEALLVALTGSVFGLIANSLSPRGLSLTRNYFPNSTVPSPAPQTAVPSPGFSGQAASNYSSIAPSSEGVTARLRAKGLQPLPADDALQAFHDPLYSQQLIVFVDARDDAHYQAGHIPGAYQFDRYYPDKYLPAVLPACGNALKIIVYCTGGACEDSEFAATTLKEAGMPAEKLFVFAGGITEWTARGWPVETGERNSGQVRETKP